LVFIAGFEKSVLGNSAGEERGGHEVTAPAAIKQADLKRMAAIAKSEGVVVEIEHNGLKIKVSADKSTDAPVVQRGGIRL
jgi:hypothetical protein